MANRIYVLYPSGGGFSNDTIDYHGTSYAVAAASSRQAHVLARGGVWATDPARPQGIVEIYEKGTGEPGDHRLWCGCRVFWGLGVRHGAGARAITAAMRKHLAEDHPSPASTVR